VGNGLLQQWCCLWHGGSDGQQIDGLIQSQSKWLERARTNGFFRAPSKVSLLRTDTDLDVIRSQSDFHLLIMDLSFLDNPFDQRTDQIG
jgi:hypothetical protein